MKLVYLLLPLLAVGCSPGHETPPEDSTDVVEEVRSPGLFDPDTLAVGDTLLGFRVARADFRRTFDDSVWVGGATFDGEVTVSGIYASHFDCQGDPLACFPCFYTDSTSSARLPRMVGDERYAWFCFENREEVQSALGEPLPGGRSGVGELMGGRPAQIVIDEYRYVFEFSDVFNAADFVRESE